MINAQGTERALKLAQRIQPILSRSMAKETQAVSVETVGTMVLLESGPEQTKMAPGSIRIKASSDDFTGVIISR
jgi:hypothetical protein